MWSKFCIRRNSMCFKCVAEKMPEAELLEIFEFAQNNIGKARLAGKQFEVELFTIEMFVTRMVWQNRERETIAQLNAGQSILMDFLKQTKEQ